MRKILFLGGFPQMIDIILTAKAMGFYTVLADRNPTAPARKFVDFAVDLSTDRIEELTAFCESNKVDGVFTGFEDFNIHVACELCHRLELPFYASKEQLSVITDKNRFKSKCREYQIPIVDECSLEQAAVEKKYPYIIKPADSYGSRGITVCGNVQQLMTGYRKAFSVSPTQTVIIERFIDNSYGVELFYTIVNGHIYLSATADRHTVRKGETNVPLPIAEVFPSRHRSEIIKSLDPYIRQMLLGMQLNSGLVLIQALYSNGAFYVYEMAYRLTGEQHYRLVAKQQGINLAKMMILLAVGEDISEFDSEKLKDEYFIKPSINLAVFLKPGTIAHISGLSNVFGLDEVVSYNLTHFQNDIITSSGDYSQMLIRINMVAKDYDKLSNAVRSVYKYIQVLSEMGEDMIAARFSLPEVV